MNIAHFLQGLFLSSRNLNRILAREAPEKLSPANTNAWGSTGSPETRPWDSKNGKTGKEGTPQTQMRVVYGEILQWQQEQERIKQSAEQ
jgi:hypothetical protein